MEISLDSPPTHPTNTLDYVTYVGRLRRPDGYNGHTVLIDVWETRLGTWRMVWDTLGAYYTQPAEEPLPRGSEWLTGARMNCENHVAKSDKGFMAFRTRLNAAYPKHSCFNVCPVCGGWFGIETPTHIRQAIRDGLAAAERERSDIRCKAAEREVG